MPKFATREVTSLTRYGLRFAVSCSIVRTSLELAAARQSQRCPELTESRRLFIALAFGCNEFKASFPSLVTLCVSVEMLN